MIEKITILHINDWHSHFETFPKIKRFFKTFDNPNHEVIKMDIGDNIDRWHPMTEATEGLFNVQLMNELGIDFATIGNNEGIGLSKSMLNRVYKTANFKMIVGNLEDNGKLPVWSMPYHVYETVFGTKIAFLAYTFPYYLTYHPNGWEVQDPITCLKRDLDIPAVQAADFRVVLSHLGLPLDKKITKDVQGIDLIIGAHTHHVFEHGDCQNGIYLAAAGKYGQFIGEITIMFDNHELTDITIRAHDTNYMSKNLSDCNWVRVTEARGHELLRQNKIKQLTQKLNLEASCHLVMKAMRDYANADVAIINSGLVVAHFAMEITKDTLHHALPHPMRLVTLDITIEELKEICQDIFAQASLLAHQTIRGMGFRGKEFGTILTSGFQYKHGKIVYNKKVITENKTIRLVLVDQYYYAPYFKTVKQHQVKLLFPDLLRELVENYLKKN